MKAKLDQIKRAYDPEHDLVSGGPRVTHTDLLLWEIIHLLVERIEALEIVEEER